MSTEPSNDRRVEQLVTAVFFRAVDILDIDVDAAQVATSVRQQIDVDFLDEPIGVSGVEIDSLSLVDILATIEVELDIVLFDQDDVELMPTLRSLGQYILEQASSDEVDRFLQTWCGVSATPSPGAAGAVAQ